MKYCEKSIRSVCSSTEEIVRRIYDKMISERPAKEVIYRPFTPDEKLNLVHRPTADFGDFYPDFSDGDYAFITSDVDWAFDFDIVYNISTEALVEVYLNGEKQELLPPERAGSTYDVMLSLREGRNRVITKVIAKDKKFKISEALLVPHLRMGADGYVYKSHQRINIDGFKGQEGIALSRLYKKDEAQSIDYDKIEWVYPKKPEQSNEKVFDFNDKFDRGSTAYVHTAFEGEMTITHNSPLKIFADGEEIYCKDSGEVKKTFTKETCLLFKSKKADNEWGFRTVSDGKHTLPFAETDDCDDLKWVWVGPFGIDGDNIDFPYAPEEELKFSEPYPSVHGDVYWRFYRENTYLRQYLVSLFAQWFYANMVGVRGMNITAQKLNIKEFYPYFKACISTICNHKRFGQYDSGIHGWSSYMANASKFDDLDSLGTFGMNIADYYLMTGDIKAQWMLEVLSNAALHNIPRFEDGTYNRVKTMWTDDMYMCLPFLVRMGAITGDKKYFDEVVKQVKGFYDRMFMEDENIYSHIYFPPEKVANRIPWGRGNGWVLLALSEVLLYMPKDYEGREEVLNIYRRFAKGVLACRDKKEGMWHQVINNHNSYVETSGSAMFITGLARGIKNGWLDDSIKNDVIEAWEALTEKCVDTDANVYGICMGSGCSMDEEYYINLGTVTNDDHGIGVVLMAGTSVMDIE